MKLRRGASVGVEQRVRLGQVSIGLWVRLQVLLRVERHRICHRRRGSRRVVLSRREVPGGGEGGQGGEGGEGGEGIQWSDSSLPHGGPATAPGPEASPEGGA